MCTLTLVYPDNSKFIVGGFPSQAAAEAWLAKEQAKPYWINGTTHSIDLTPQAPKAI